MISALQNALSKHNRILMTVLAAFLAFVFIFGFTNFSTAGLSPREMAASEFYGLQLRNPRAVRAAELGTLVSFQVSGDTRPRQNAEVQQELFTRAVLLYLADRLGVPQPEDAQLAPMIRQQAGFLDPQTGRFDAVRVQRLQDDLDLQSGETGLLRRTMEEQWRIEQVRQALGGPGFALPFLAQVQQQQQDTRWTLAVASFPRAGFSPEIAPDELALEVYFGRNAVRYQTPRLLRAAAVSFPAANFVQEVPDPADTVLLARFLENRDSYPMPEPTETAAEEPIVTEEASAAAELESPEEDSGDPTEADSVEAAEGVIAEADGEKDESAHFAAVRAQVLRDWKLEQAKTVALRRASEFSNLLYETFRAAGVVPTPEQVREVAESKGLTLQPLAPFNPLERRGQGRFSVREMGNAGLLTPERPYTDLVTTIEGPVIFVYQGEIPAVTPPLEEVRERVLADYRDAERDRLFSARGAALATELRAAVAAGEPFTEAAEARGLSVVRPEPFRFSELRTFPTGIDSFMLDALNGLKLGEVSGPFTNDERAAFLFALDKEVPELESGSVDGLVAELRENQARLTELGILRDLIEAGLPKASGATGMR